MLCAAALKDGLAKVGLQTLRLDNRRSVVGGSEWSQRCCRGLRCAAGAALSYVVFLELRNKCGDAAVSVAVDCFKSRGRGGTEK